MLNSNYSNYFTW